MPHFIHISFSSICLYKPRFQQCHGTSCPALVSQDRFFRSSRLGVVPRATPYASIRGKTLQNLTSKYKYAGEYKRVSPFALLCLRVCFTPRPGSALGFEMARRSANVRWEFIRLINRCRPASVEVIAAFRDGEDRVTPRIRCT